METISRPLKRHIALRSLSREHHEALLFVWKIRDGVRKAISLVRIARFCSWYWDTHLQAHMAQEEACFRKVLTPESQLMNNMIEDHAAIKVKLEQVIEDPSYDVIKRLAEIIYYHVRFEERFLFPAIERVASDNQLTEIQAQLGDEEKKYEWRDAFWLSKTTLDAA